MKFWRILVKNLNRLESGGRIDRSKSLSFSFNGKLYYGYEGDTLASAMLANGLHVIARSFKYHRPRGIIGSGVEDPTSLIELLGEEASGNNLCTNVKLKEGLKAKSINCWPSVDFDVGAVVQYFAKFIPAGFYYKTFKWPTWHLFEPFIRIAAGLASAPKEPPKKGHFESRNAHTDFLIIGAGPAGLLATLMAARSGAKVFLVDQNTEAGGSLLSLNLNINQKPAMAWVESTLKEIANMSNVTHLQNSTAWAYREHNLVIVNEREVENVSIIERSWRVRAKNIIIATGAIERSLVFPNNDRPGVMLASAVLTFVNRYSVKPSDNMVLFTNNDSVYSYIEDLKTAGINVLAIVDSRKHIASTVLANAQNVRVILNSIIRNVNGYKKVNSVVVQSLVDKELETISCDLLAHSGGWNPMVHLHSQSRGTVKFNDRIASFVPDQSIQNSISIGACNGTFTLNEIFNETKSLLCGVSAHSKPLVYEGKLECSKQSYSIEALWSIDLSKEKNKAFFDIQNDVTHDDIQLALTEGYSNIEHVKRYTTGGMGFDQGKTGNVNIIGMVAKEQGIGLDDVGTTTFRSPFVPVSFGSISGVREGSVVLPFRHTPITKWNLENGAFMYEAGARWRRPGYFPIEGESFQETVNRECHAVRTSVGVYDGSPLGKFELKGENVGEFLDLIYTNIISSLEPGNGRYGLMLTDDGLIFDDGVAFRIDKHRWFISTSSGHSDAVYQHMLKILAFDHPEWDVKITNITNQWNNATICGPLARKLLKKLGTDIDCDNGSFPFMTFREGHIADIPARIIRVSFTGELSFEINVSPRNMLALWERIIEDGAEFGILPVGSEASHVLRVEKGFLSLGHEVDGTVDPYDLGMAWLMSKKKIDYIGKRSVHLRRSLGRSRRELVGLLPNNPNDAIPEGAPITPDGKKVATEGFTTACVWSVVNERWVGLALLENGHIRHGEEACVRMKDKIIRAKITKPVFHDSDGILLRS
ncbi:MAG: sarcosine oxidase subunit alpha [Rhodobacteraceae bacterium]|nr:MAG: sarcosine oxidase subunit alpha [Paracoccaceae bacterium]